MRHPALPRLGAAAPIGFAGRLILATMLLTACATPAGPTRSASSEASSAASTNAGQATAGQATAGPNVAVSVPPDSKDPGPGRTMPSGLSGTYRSIRVRGIPLPPGNPVTANFSRGKVVIRAGCNTMSGTPRATGGFLEVGDLQMTEMSCGAVLDKSDRAVADFFGARPRFKFDGPALVLAAAQSEVVMEPLVIDQPDTPPDTGKPDLPTASSR